MANENVRFAVEEIIDALESCNEYEGTAALVSATIKWCEALRLEGGEDPLVVFSEMLLETRNEVDSIWAQ